MNNDNQTELIPAEKRIQYLSECLTLKDGVIEEKDKQLKILIDEIELKQKQILIYKDVESNAEITIHNQSKEILLKASEIESLEERLSASLLKNEDFKAEFTAQENRYFAAKKEGDEAIHNLEMSQFWKAVSLVALSVVVSYAIILSIVHFGNHFSN